MIKTVNLFSLCVAKNYLEPLHWYYKSGKSSISIAQHVIAPDMAIKSLYPNYYIHNQTCLEIEKVHPGFQEKSMQSIDIGDKVVNSLFRLIIKANIGNKDLGLQINSLKSNPYLRKLTTLKQSNKFNFKASQIILDDIIEQKPGSDITQILKPNILEAQKLIQQGLGLPISFMISKSNVASSAYLNLLAKKRKSIHSSVIECTSVSGGAGGKKSSLEEVVYNNGFRLEHLFLRPYLKGCPSDSLADNDSFNLEQLLKVLAIIDFDGKIVLQNTGSFSSNIEILDATLKKCGYMKKRLGDIDLIDQYMII